MKNKALLKNLLIIIFSILLTFLMAKFNLVFKLEYLIGNDYLLAFVAGMLFVSFFTVIPASFVLLNLSANNEIIFLAATAGLGAMLIDLIIFMFFRKNFQKSLFERNKKLKFEKIRQHKIFKVCLPIIGACIIASPFPDEIGVALMGASDMSKKYFILLTYFLNAVGIYLLLLTGKILS